MPRPGPDRESRGASRRAGLASAALALILAAPAPAQDWHDAYQAGTSALARGDHARAAEALERAITLHPEPGRNVVTYGTNLEPRYFPYLRLAEARLALGQLEAARAALERSASWGPREPAEERAALQGRLAAAVAARLPPPPAAPAPTPTPVAALTPPAASPPAAAVEPATPAPEPTRTTQPPAPPATAATPVVRPERAPTPAAAPASAAPTSAAPASAGPAPAPPLPTATAPQFGAPAGPSGAATNPVGETAAPRASDARYPLLAFALLALAIAAAIGGRALRRPSSRAPAGAPTPRSGATDPGAQATPRGFMNPGARLDEEGREWFGDYRLLEMLGRGGMASVFEAERKGERVALKRPLASLLDDQPFLDRFLREAEIGRTLNHPNIVRILERGHVLGVPYFTMELVPGETLFAYMRRQGASPPEFAARVVVQIAEALDLAHHKGVVHRDLKPSNIMLLPDGSARVMDFGIARAQRFDTLTATSAFLGTPHYVAPEMIEGAGAEPRSDLYALGVVLFELVTGQRPFDADTPFAILKKHCLEEPPVPSRLRPGLPPEIDAVVRQLLRKDVADRPASAEALVIALRDYLNRAA